jgi:hypothetical protein
MMETGHLNQLIDEVYFVADNFGICRSKDPLARESFAPLFPNCFQSGRVGEGMNRKRKLEIPGFSVFLSLCLLLVVP